MSSERKIPTNVKLNTQSAAQAKDGSGGEILVRPFRPTQPPPQDVRITVVGTVGGGNFSARFRIAPELSELGKSLMARQRAKKREHPTSESR